MRKPVKVLLAIVAILGLVVVFIAMARAQIGLLGPHVVQPSLARFDAPLDAAIRYQIEAEKPQTVDAAMRLALKITGNQLRFGLGHPTKFAFGADVRAANCIEYSHLFVKIFEMAASRNKIAAKAQVVHSSRAEVFGQVLPFPGLRDHDWVVIVDNVDKRKLFVDPAFADAGLGWDLAPNVVGDVRAGP